MSRTRKGWAPKVAKFSAEEKADAAFKIPLDHLSAANARLARGQMRQSAEAGKLTLLRAFEIINAIDPPEGYRELRKDRADFEAWIRDKEARWHARF